MMNREPIRNRAVNAFAAHQIQYRPPLTRVFAKAVSYLAAYIDNNCNLLLYLTRATRVSSRVENSVIKFLYLQVGLYTSKLHV